MEKFNIFVCENFSPEFQNIIEKEGFDDVAIKAYSCMCGNKKEKVESSRLLKESMSDGNEGLVFCNNYCDIVKIIPKETLIKKYSANYCHSHIVNESFINYIIEKGGYVIGLGWLNNWKQRIESGGFDKDTARRYYKEFCNELVFFDAGSDAQAEEKLKELSEFLKLPYVIILFDTKIIEAIVRSAVFEWRLRKKSQEYAKSLAEMQSQCAEYSAILDLTSKLSSETTNRDTIEKIKEIFTIIFGAQKFKYWSSEYGKGSISKEIEDMFLGNKKSYLLIKKQNKFYIKIQNKDKVFGIIEVSDFLFPHYIEKYLNFAIEITKICGLVLSNIEQYESIMNSEQKYQFLSFHDSLTGLFNRTYINEKLDIKKVDKYLAVFVFDIDKLKYVNDNFGHSEGDRLIVGISDILRTCFRETDTVARIGGDEFLAILPDCDIQMAELFRNRINEAIASNNKDKKKNICKLVFL